MTLLTIALNVYLFVDRSQGVLPAARHGRLTGAIQAAQDISFQAMQEKLTADRRHHRATIRPSTTCWASRAAGGGGATTNTARLFIMLKPLEERTAQRGSGDRAAARAAGRGARGASVPAGGAGSPRRRPREQRAVPVHAPGRRRRGARRLGDRRVAERLRTLPQLVDVNSDQQDKGRQSSLVIDRGTASRLGITPQLIDDTLYDAFGQRQVSTHVHAAEPVPRGDGGRAALLAAPRDAAGHLRPLRRAARRCR